MNYFFQFGGFSKGKVLEQMHMISCSSGWDSKLLRFRKFKIFKYPMKSIFQKYSCFKYSWHTFIKLNTYTDIIIFGLLLMRNSLLIILNIANRKIKFLKNWIKFWWLANNNDLNYLINNGDSMKILLEKFLNENSIHKKKSHVSQINLPYSKFWNFYLICIIIQL